MASTLKLGNGNWGVKEDSLLAYSDKNNNFLPFPFDFSRASSATVVNKAGLIETVQSGISRIDFSDDANGALKLEPQSTNLIPYSSDFSSLNALSNALVTSNQIIAPSGLLDADEITFDGTSNGRVEASLSVTNGATYTISVYLKNKDLSDVTQVWIGFAQLGQGQFITITDEWQRYEITLASNGTTEYPRIQFSGSGSLYAWGFQTEQSSYATSYIPTQEAISTRLSDAINQQITNLTSVQEGTFFLDFDRGLTNGTVRDGNTDGFFYRSGSSFPATNAIEIATDIDGKVRLAVRMNGFSQLYVNNTLSRYKMLIKWSGTSVNVFVNGVLEYTSTARWTATLPLQYIGYNSSFRKNVHQLLTYSTALTDAECITLTTI